MEQDADADVDDADVDDADMDHIAEPSAPAFAVRDRPKFREVALPPGPPPLPRRPPLAGSVRRADAAPDDSEDRS